LSAAEADPWSPVVLPDARGRRLRSAATGADYRITVATPPGPAPAQGFPVVYVLDGTVTFACLADAVARLGRRTDATGVRPAVVVGIGSATGDLQDVVRRHLDFTAGASIDDDPLLSRVETGGADRFLAFIEDELKPLVAGLAPVDPARQSLLGHSLAGYFVLHALAARPDAFAAFGAVSPSVWWDDARLRAALEAMPISAARAYVAVGGREEESYEPPMTPAQARRARRRMVGHAHEVGLLLERRLGPDRAAFEVLPDEDHASAVPIGFVRFLRFLG
jgi:predicted alpha/beta superfamily hydrolase